MHKGAFFVRGSEEKENFVFKEKERSCDNKIKSISLHKKYPNDIFLHEKSFNRFFAWMLIRKMITWPDIAFECVHIKVKSLPYKSESIHRTAEKIRVAMLYQY